MFYNLLQYIYSSDERVAGTTKAFKLCSFEIVDFMAMRAVSRRWTWAADYCIDEIAKLLTCLPTHTFTPTEAELLWRNRRYLVGHRRWMVQLLRSIDWNKNCLCVEHSGREGKVDRNESNTVFIIWRFIMFFTLPNMHMHVHVHSRTHIYICLHVNLHL